MIFQRFFLAHIYSVSHSLVKVRKEEKKNNIYKALQLTHRLKVYKRYFSVLKF